jgi:hypothetical protein
MTGCDKKEEATLKSISVSGSYLTEYVVGETFSSAGVVVTAEYSDGSKKDVSSEAAFSGFSSAEAGSGSVTVSFGGQSTSINYSVVKGYRFSDAEADYKEAGVSVFIPVYEGEVEVSYDEDGFYLITGSSAEAMDAYAEKLVAAGWAVSTDSWGDWSGLYKDTRAEIYLGDWSEYPEEDPLGGIKVVFDLNVFPVDFIEYLFSALEVEGVVVPDYASSAEGLYFEVDTSYLEYGLPYLFVYVDYSTNEEMTAYVAALIESGWAQREASEDGTEYLLQFGETEAWVAVSDFTAEDEEEPYIAFMFFYQEASEE